MKLELLLICSLLGLGSAWNQPSTCLVRQSSRSDDSKLGDDITKILESSLHSFSTSLEQLGSNLPNLTFQMDNLTRELNEMNTQIQRHLKSQEQELQEMKHTQARSLKILERIQLIYSNDSSTEIKFDQEQDVQPFMPTDSEASTSQEVSASTISTYPSDEVLPIASTALLNGSYQHPVNSCNDLPLDYPSGEYYTLNTCNKTPVKVYCDMTRTACNSTGGWTRVMMLDMTNSSHSCPDNFKLITRSSSKPHRLCGLKTFGCTSTIVKTFGISYSMVCGRIKAYQYGRPMAFYRHNHGIESYYVDGVSLTYGRPGARKHIWTFAAGSEETVSTTWTCPCTRTDLNWPGTVPSFVGSNYFCDTANHDRAYVFSVEFYDDPLWDGDGCVSTSTCCCFNTPPWFCAELPESTTTNIELRLCTSFHAPSYSDVPIELAEIYVK